MLAPLTATFPNNRLIIPLWHPDSRNLSDRKCLHEGQIVPTDNSSYWNAFSGTAVKSQDICHLDHNNRSVEEGLGCGFLRISMYTIGGKLGIIVGPWRQREDRVTSKRHRPYATLTPTLRWRKNGSIGESSARNLIQIPNNKCQPFVKQPVQRRSIL